jgi:hypothetical protein
MHASAPAGFLPAILVRWWRALNPPHGSGVHDAWPLATGRRNGLILICICNDVQYDVSAAKLPSHLLLLVTADCPGWISGRRCRIDRPDADCCIRRIVSRHPFLPHRGNTFYAQFSALFLWHHHEISLVLSIQILRQLYHLPKINNDTTETHTENPHRKAMTYPKFISAKVFFKKRIPFTGPGGDLAGPSPK